METGISLQDVKPRVLVIGATRGTGYKIVSLLLQQGYRVRALARNEAKAKRTLGFPVEVVLGDITKADTLLDAINGSSSRAREQSPWCVCCT